MKWRIFLYGTAAAMATLAAIALAITRFPLVEREIIFLSPTPWTKHEASARVEDSIRPFLEVRYLNDVDLTAAKNALLELDWVEFAALRRRAPGIVVVTIRPRRVIGSIELTDGTFMPVDARGHVIRERFLDGFLPVVYGDGGAQGLPRLLSLLSRHPEIRNRLQSATLVNNLRWDITIAGRGGEVLIRLPVDEADLALGRVLRQGLLTDPLSEIDIRAGTRIFVRER